MKKPNKKDYLIPRPAHDPHRKTNYITISIDQPEDLKTAYETLSAVDFETWEIDHYGVGYTVVEKEEDYKARQEAEKKALEEYEVAQDKLNQKYTEELQKYQAFVKENNREKYNDPDYIEFLRAKAKLKEKGINAE